MQTPADGPKSILQNDLLLVCSMFIIYGICILGLIGAGLFGLNKRNQRISANETATAVVVATDQAEVTTTAIVHATEQAQYQVIDKFDTNKNRWLTGYASSEYWNGDRSVKDGVYTWEVNKVKKTFVSWANYSSSEDIKDFDAYVDMKLPDTPVGDVCSGLIFRKLERVNDTNDYYYYVLCNNSVAKVNFHGGKEGWERMATVQVFATPSNWNRLEVSARGSHFTFAVNGVSIFEMDDDRLDTGSLALTVEVKERIPAIVLFDNFGFQNRDSTYSTATPVALSTYEKEIFATAMVDSTQQARFEFADQFDGNKFRWSTERANNKYFDGSIEIKDGTYRWDVTNPKQAFVYWSDFRPYMYLKDFDVYVDTKLPDTTVGNVCSGIIFRKSEQADDIDDYYYYFSFCNSSVVKVSYHAGKEGWENITTINISTPPKDWNRLEVSARGSHFTFMLNNVLVYEMDDARLDAGGLALAVEVKDQVPALILFDNFGYHRP